MRQLLTTIKCIDNTGIKKLKCIGLLYKHTSINIGTIFKGIVKKVKTNINIKRGQLFRAIVVKTKKKYKNKQGKYTQFKENGAIIINNDKIPQGTRIFGIISDEIRKKFPKIASLAHTFI